MRKRKKFKKRLDSVLRYRVYNSYGGEKMKHLTTGQLAKKAGVNVETIRYYERRGLLPEPLRRESGYRVYSPNDVSRIQFIICTVWFGGIGRLHSKKSIPTGIGDFSLK